MATINTNDNKISLSFIVTAGVIAAIYAALTILLAPISFSAVQFRVSEALTLLPVILPQSIPGLAIGCLLSNLIVGAPWQDVVFGSLATLLAAFATRQFKHHIWLAAFMPVFFNGLIVGAVLSWLYALPFWATAGTVAMGEAAVCYMLGIPLIQMLKKHFKDEKVEK
ncbi:MAG: QueT transporter family protein [Eubacteriales bacterium]|nr:QueT transporter family protein [Eubacteriales bacterium]